MGGGSDSSTFPTVPRAPLVAEEPRRPPSLLELAASPRVQQPRGFIQELACQPQETADFTWVEPRRVHGHQGWGGLQQIPKTEA